MLHLAVTDPDEIMFIDEILHLLYMYSTASFIDA